MSGRTITVTLPDDLYEWLRRRASGADHAVAQVVVDVLRSATSGDEARPNDLDPRLRTLPGLSDAELWVVAQSRLTDAEAEEIADLNWKAQRQALTRRERARQEQLVAEFDRRLLLRSYALKLLMDRGHDVSGLLTISK